VDFANGFFTKESINIQVNQFFSTWAGLDLKLSGARNFPCGKIKCQEWKD